jgi:hypothetical protein
MRIAAFLRIMTLVLMSLITLSCKGDEGGPGMILSFGSVINGRSVDLLSAKLPNGDGFPAAGSFGGGGTRKWGTWKNIPTKVMAASGDHRGLPDWVEFEWREPPYPEDPTMSLETYRALPKKNQKLEIKSRVPQEVVDAVIESKRNAPRGKMAGKSLWLYLFWTPEGVKMRWALKVAKDGSGFGPIEQEGGDDLDRYNLK